MQANESHVAYIATTYYNISPLLGSIKRLPGYDDRNFLLTDSSDHKTYVLKIVNRNDSHKQLTDIIDEVLDGAHQYCQAKLAVSPSHFVVPKLIRTSGAKLSTLTTIPYLSRAAHATGEPELEEVKCNIKLCEFFDGRTVYDHINGAGSLLRQRDAPQDARRHARLYSRLGAACSQLFAFLRSQQHLVGSLAEVRGATANLWLLKGYEQPIRRHLDHLYPKPEEARRKLVLQVLRDYETSAKPKLALLPEFVIHSDLGTKNMLVDAHNLREADDAENLKICLIDFQDLQVGPRLAELAFLMLYCVIEQESLAFESALALLPRWIYSGYRSASTAWPLEASELVLVPSVMQLRLCQSLLNGLMAFEREPENSYVMQTNQRGWSLLELLSDPASVFGRPDELAALWLQ